MTEMYLNGNKGGRELVHEKQMKIEEENGPDGEE